MEDLVVLPKVLDVTNEAQIEELAAGLADEFDHLDLLVNNAGINSKGDGDEAKFMKSVVIVCKIILGIDNLWNGQSLEWTIFGMDNLWNGQSLEWTIFGMDNLRNGQPNSPPRRG